MLKRFSKCIQPEIPKILGGNENGTKFLGKKFPKICMYLSENVDPFVTRVSQFLKSENEISGRMRSADKFKICSSKDPFSSQCYTLARVLSKYNKGLGASLSGIHFSEILRGEWTAYSTVCEKEKNNLGSDT